MPIPIFLTQNFGSGDQGPKSTVRSDWLLTKPQYKPYGQGSQDLVVQADEGQDENILLGLAQRPNYRGAVPQCDAKRCLLRELLLTASQAAANCKIGIFHF